MVAPVHKDGLTDYQLKLASTLRIFSPISGMFTGNEFSVNVEARSVRVPDIRVDDYIVDAEIGRIGADHYSGSEFTAEWKNGIPPIYWREYSMSRHRAFGYTVFEEQERKAPIKNLPQAYLARKMQYTVLRDHDKYLLFVIMSGHMTGKLVARTAADAVGPDNPDAYRISHTGNAADYKWIAEPGEDYDNQIQPSFATITAFELDSANPLDSVDELTLLFADNWFDSNFSDSDRFLLITPALELVFIKELIDAGAGTESAWQMLRNGNTSGAFSSAGQANGYLGQIKGSWKIIKIHPEFLPKLYIHDTTLVVNPIADTNTPDHTLTQVVGLAAYKNAAQVYDYFSELRSEDGGTRFRGTEYVQDMSYDGWVIDQYSDGIVPLVLPSDDSAYELVDESFTNVAAMVAASRAQTGVTAGYQYPINPPTTDLSTPEWYNSPYEGTTNIDTGLTVTETGDMAHRNPLLASDDTQDSSEAAAAYDALLAGTPAYADGAYTLGDLFKIGDMIFQVTDAGTSVSGDDDTLALLAVGETGAFGTGATEGAAKRLS